MSPALGTVPEVELTIRNVQSGSRSLYDSTLNWCMQGKTGLINIEHVSVFGIS